MTIVNHELYGAMFQDRDVEFDYLGKTHFGRFHEVVVSEDTQSDDEGNIKTMLLETFYRITLREETDSALFRASSVTRLKGKQ